MGANIGAMKVYAAAQAIERAARLDQRLPEDELVTGLPALVEAASIEVRRLAEDGAPKARLSA